MADWPAGNGRTPLEEAAVPGMDYMARHGSCGLVRTVPEGMAPGSDVANLSLLGYEPSLYYTGRGPLEAAALGIPVLPGDYAYRFNLVNLDKGIMNDYSAGHIDTESAGLLVDELQQELGSEEFSFHKGVSYRHILIWKNGTLLECVPPHDIQGRPVADYLPRGERAASVLDLMERAWEVLAIASVNMDRRTDGLKTATGIWPWGGGAATGMESFRDRFGLKAAVITAVDLIRGLAVSAGMDIVEVPGATGYIDTDYAAKGAAAAEALADHDLVFVHIEAPDEASHAGMRKEKTEAIASIDRHVVSPLLHLAREEGDIRLLVLPDHATPLEIRTHSNEPVPFAVWPSDGPGAPAYTEAGALSSGLDFPSGTALLRYFLNQEV